jgi:hypothetical protein
MASEDGKAECRVAGRLATASTAVERSAASADANTITGQELDCGGADPQTELRRLPPLSVRQSSQQQRMRPIERKNDCPRSIRDENVMLSME